jgi:type IV pilus assembly protein PilY1
MSRAYKVSHSRRAGVLMVATLAAFTGASVRSASPPAALPISTVPLTVQIPAHPQILLALANSESVDGDLSGAIFTGAGGLATNLSGLNATSSAVSYTVPAGFVAPVTLTAAGGTAPYTSVVGGNQVDNSASRLNVSKAGITAILQTFLPVADFGLIDYQLSGGFNTSNTWVYYMSNAGGFVFTNNPGTNTHVANPCYGITLDTANPVDSACKTLNTRYPGINTYTSVLVQASSDDPAINDVFYDGGGGGFNPVCVVYGTVNPATPYPPNRTLAQYNSGSIFVSYGSQSPNSCMTTTGPTNAGYVPYSTEVMYAQRGFGFYAGQTSQPSSLTSWPPLVTMSSAGGTPTAATIATALAKFTPYLAPETNNTATTEIKAVAIQSPIAGLLQASQDYYQSANPASSNGCSAQRFVVLITDGLPTLDLAHNNWPPLGSSAAAGYGVTATFNADGSLTTTNTNDQALIDTINALTALKTANIKTYIIGVGAGVDPTKNPQAAATLTAMAMAGGTTNYFPATSPGDLTNDMQVIVAKILATTQSTASTAVNTTGLHAGALAYLAKFTTADSYQDWTGDFSAYPIAANGQVATTAGSAAWSAATQLDVQTYTGRMIATWDPQLPGGTPFRWNAALAPKGISGTTTLGMQLSTFTGDTNGSDVVNYIRGNTAQEVRNGGKFRNRTHRLGDIVDSSPLYVGTPVGLTQSASYAAFVALHASRAPILYVGANDGMLHAIDAATGNERFAYIPNAVFANLVKLVNPYYNSQHLFYVDGSPQAADVQFSDGHWHTVLVGTEGAGGQSLFALDVTDADTFVSEAQVAGAALWEFTDTNLGLTFSTPQIVNTNAGWLVFAGNGYNSTAETPYLYALNPQTGAIVSKINLCAAVTGVCNAAAANGLSSTTVINSYGEPTLPADTVYAGDLQGNVWRVDISNANPANWVVTVIYQTKDGSGNAQPITTAPAVTLNPLYPSKLGTMVYVGTGQMLTVADLSTIQTQTLYGIFDPPRGSSPPLGFSGIPTRANLVAQTMSSSTVGSVPVRVETTVNPVTIPTNRGWYVDYNLASGERIITNPQVESGGGVVLTSYQPNASACTGGGNAWLSVFNYATGGSFKQPELDISGNAQISAADSTSTGLNPVAMSLGSVYASAATILPAGGNNSGATPGAFKMTATSAASITSIGDRGQLKQRTGWWEVLN